MPVPAGLGGFYGRKLSDLPEAEAEKIRQQRRGRGWGPGATGTYGDLQKPTTYVPPAEADATTQELILNAIDDWNPVLMKALGLGAVGAVAYMLYHEALGKPTLISKFALSQTGSEMVRGAWGFLGKAAQAGVSNPTLGLLTAWAAIQLMQKSKLVTEKAGVVATTAIFGLEALDITSDAIGGIVAALRGGKTPLVGPSTVNYGDGEHVDYRGYESPGLAMLEWEKAHAQPTGVYSSGK